MPYNLLIEEDAKPDIADAFNWYSRISTTLGNRFLSELKNALDYITSYPEMFKIAYAPYRQAPLKKFPFVILYKIDGNCIKIYRILPTKMDRKTQL